MTSIDPASPSSILEGYSLLDSGEGEKLERFGEVIIRRPSSLAIWKKRYPGRWSNADASYKAKEEWKYRAEKFETWTCDFSSFSMELRLQTNGQVGVFPEHATALSFLNEFILETQSQTQTGCKVLNLFAYTGMHTVVSALYGASVTHVDISKSALDWATRNLAANQIEQGSVRFIKEDVVSFLEREARRGNKYDVIISDPPSFSRISKNDTWDLEDKILSINETISKLMNKERGLVISSSHHGGLDSSVLANILSDTLRDLSPTITRLPLNLVEEREDRLLPAGNMAIARW